MMATSHATTATFVRHTPTTVHDQTVAQESRRFFWLFLVLLTIISLPVKNLAYIAPPLYLFVLLLLGDLRVLPAVILALTALTISAISLLIDHLSGQAVNMPGMFLAVLTYLPLFIFLGSRLGPHFDSRVFQQLVQLIAWYVILQSLLGCAQFALSGNADAVAGTMGLFDFYFDSISIIQVYYTFNLFGMILFLLLNPKGVLVQVAIVFGLLACVLAQSGHQTVFFLLSFLAVSAVQFRRIGTVLAVITLVAFVAAGIMQFYPNTWEQTIAWYNKAVHHVDSPKRMATVQGLKILSEPKNAILGTGMGQYSSRASLITSGEYLNRELPKAFLGKSRYYRQSIAPAIQVFKQTGEGSAISKPYYSALSLLVELGPFFTLGIVLLFLMHLRRNLSWALSKSPELARTGLVCCVGLIFTALCCSIENYLEFPQALLIPILLYFVAQSHGQEYALSHQSHSPGAAKAAL